MDNNITIYMSIKCTTITKYNINVSEAQLLLQA